MTGQETITYPRHYKVAKGYLLMLAFGAVIFIGFTVHSIKDYLKWVSPTLDVLIFIATLFLFSIALHFAVFRNLITSLTLQNRSTLIIRTLLAERSVDVQSIQSVAVSSFGSMPRMRCGGRLYHVPPAMDGWHNFLSILKTLNPSVTFKNC